MAKFPSELQELGKSTTTQVSLPMKMDFALDAAANIDEIKIDFDKKSHILVICAKRYLEEQGHDIEKLYERGLELQ